MSNYTHDYLYLKGKRSNKYKKYSSNESKELINEIKYNIRLNRLDTALSLVEDYLYNDPNNNYVLGYKAMILDKLGNTKESI